MQEKLLQKTLIEHLKDLKGSLIRFLCLFIVIFLTNFYYTENIFNFLLKITQFSDLKLIFTSVESALMAKLSLSFQVALIILIPYFAIEILIFCKEALSKTAFKKAVLILISGIALYIFSLALTIKIIIPLFINFLMSFNFFGIDFYINTSTYIAFITKTLVVFGFIFETPIILILAINFNLIKLEVLTKNRKFIFLLCFILGAILTPPDVLSQIIAATLIYIFFEIAIFFSKYIR